MLRGFTHLGRAMMQQGARRTTPAIDPALTGATHTPLPDLAASLHIPGAEPSTHAPLDLFPAPPVAGPEPPALDVPPAAPAAAGWFDWMAPLAPLPQSVWPMPGLDVPMPAMVDSFALAPPGTSSTAATPGPDEVGLDALELSVAGIEDLADVATVAVGGLDAWATVFGAAVSGIQAAVGEHLGKDPTLKEVLALQYDLLTLTLACSTGDAGWVASVLTGAIARHLPEGPWANSGRLINLLTRLLVALVAIEKLMPGEDEATELDEDGKDEADAPDDAVASTSTPSSPDTDEAAVAEAEGAVREVAKTVDGPLAELGAWLLDKLHQLQLLFREGADRVKALAREIWHAATDTVFAPCVAAMGMLMLLGPGSRKVVPDLDTDVA